MSERETLVESIKIFFFKFYCVAEYECIITHNFFESGVQCHLQDFIHHTIVLAQRSRGPVLLKNS